VYLPAYLVRFVALDKSWLVPRFALSPGFCFTPFTMILRLFTNPTRRLAPTPND